MRKVFAEWELVPELKCCREHFCQSTGHW